MSDGKKPDIPGAPLDDSVPTETPKLLQQELGLDRRAPRPVPSFDQLTPSPAGLRPDLKATTPYYAVSAKLREAAHQEHPVPPEYASTMISERKDVPSPIDFAKTQPSASNPVLAKQQADERLVAVRAATTNPRAIDPSLLTTDPLRPTPQAAQPARPQPLRQPLASKPLDPPAKSADVITDPMPREAVPPAPARIAAETVVQRGPAAQADGPVRIPAETVLQRGPGAQADGPVRIPAETVLQRGSPPTPKTDPMQQPDVAAAMARAPAPPPEPLAPRAPASRPPAPVERTEISRPAPSGGPSPASRPPAPMERTEISRPAPSGGPSPASHPPAPMEHTEISRPASHPPASGDLSLPAAAAGASPASRSPGPGSIAGAPAGPSVSRPPGFADLSRPAPNAAPISRPPGFADLSRPAPNAAPISRPPGFADHSRPAPSAGASPISRPPGSGDLSRPAPMAAAAPARVERTEISRPAPMAGEPPGVVPRVTSPLGPSAPTDRTDVALPQISDPAAHAAASAAPAGPPGVPMPARIAAPAGPIIDAAPTMRPPQGPQVTPTPAKQVSPHDLAPAPVRVATPVPQRAAPPPPTPPPPRPALVVPPSYVELPAAMEQPRRLGPEFATTQPGIPGPYSKPKPPPELEPSTQEVPAPVPLGLDPTDTVSDRPAVITGPDEAVASDQVLASPASLWRRALSWIFDLGALGGTVGGLLFLALTLAGGKPVPSDLHGLDAFIFRLQPIAIPAAGLAVVLALLYTTLGAVLLEGRTLGRLLLGIRLVDSSGKSPGPIRSVFRAVFAILSFALFLAGFWMAVFDRRGQTLHDKLTRTFVVRPV